MNELSNLYIETNLWQELHGVDVQYNTAKRFANAEWHEYHSEEKKQKKLLELGDVFVCTAFLHKLAKMQGLDYCTSYIECCTLIRNEGALRYIKATIASNWTKYMPKTKTTLLKASIEAEKASELYKDRYFGIVPTSSTDGNYYILIGLTKYGDKKVIKPPSYFISAEKFLD